MKRHFFLFAVFCVAEAPQLPAAAHGETIASSNVTTGLSAPDFTLTDSHGTTHALSDFVGKTVVLEWTATECAFVQKFYDGGAMQRWQAQAADAGVVWLTICSAVFGEPGYVGPDVWNERVAATQAASAAVLLDDYGTVGKLYGVAATPQVFVIDPAGVLRYQGAIDDTPSEDAADIEDAQNHLIGAVRAILDGEPVEVTQTAPYGCAVTPTIP